MSKAKYGIGCSPLTEKVYLGKQNVEKRMWVGEKIDITDQFMDVVFERFSPDSVSEIESETTGDKHLIINVSKTKKGIENLIKNLEATLATIKK